MRIVRDLAFVVLILSVAIAERANVAAMDAYTDWVAYNELICDGGFWTPNDNLVGGGECSCAGSPPSACWTYISGGENSEFCIGSPSWWDAAEAHCGEQYPTCGVHESNWGCSGGSADWTCKPLCSDPEQYPCGCYPF